MQVFCKVVRGKTPVYKTREAACADVILPVDVTLRGSSIQKVPLDLAFEIPNGYKIIMYPRSSLLINYGLMSPTSIIDSDYNGKEIHWPVVNLKKKVITLKAGTRVAQIECVPCTQVVNWERENVERTGGFGSTGGVI